MKRLHIFILLLIIIAAILVRFYNLESIPAGFHADGASQGYNAFSLSHTGKDRYGESFPIIFRAFGYYQPALYTYLTTIPVLILGNSVFAARLLSALCGSILVLITYLFLKSIFKVDEQVRLGKKHSNRVALIGALTVAFSPWAVFFSRLTIEANLGLTIFALSMTLFVLSLKKKYLFIIACLLLGLSTHAYYSERLISIIFLPAFIFLFRGNFKRNTKLVILGLFIFAITQIPHVLILQTGALTARFYQTGYVQSQSPFNLVNIFLNNYLVYYSPNNLFFDSDTNLGRTMPGLSVFFSWMLAPFIVGLWFCVKKINDLKILWLLVSLTPIPAGLTGDFFYPLRTLDFLWILTLIISIGIYKIYELISSKRIALLLSAGVLFYSLFSLYISYFILFKYEKSAHYGYAYIKLMDKLNSYKDKHIVIDSARDPGIGVRLAYFKKYDPRKIQQQLKSQLKTSYYSSSVNAYDVYLVDNIEIKPLDWSETCKKDYIFVGDRLTVSDKNMVEHNLKLEFEILNLDGEVGLIGYSSDPKAGCPEA